MADTDIREAPFDHVSHHLNIDAMEALKVPLVLVSAWIREYRRSETYKKLDNVMTPPWMFQLQLFVKGAKQRSGSCPWVETTWGCSSSPTTAGS